MKLVKKYGNWDNEANVLINAYQPEDLRHASEVMLPLRISGIRNGLNLVLAIRVHAAVVKPYGSGI